MKIYLSILSALALSLATLQAQDETITLQDIDKSTTDADAEGPSGPNLWALGSARGDSIVLRWAPADPVTWHVAYEKGYVIDRVTMIDGKIDRSTTKRITSAPLLPLTLEEFKKRFEPADTLAASAAQALFGDPIIQSQSPFGAIYEQYTQQQMMFGIGMLMADIRPDIANAMALRFVDRDVQKGMQYIYRIHSVTLRDDHHIDTARVMFIRPEDVQSLPVVNSLEAEEDELSVKLTWRRDEYDFSYSAYYIEQSLDGGKTFTRHNSRPHVAMRNLKKEDGENNPEKQKLITYQINVAENYRPIQYRIRGVNAFGQLSEPGLTITAMGVDRTPPLAPKIHEPKITDNDALKIAWSLDDPDPDLAGFIVGNSELAEGPFYSVSDLLPTNTREWVYPEAKQDIARYYIVSAVDTAGNLSNSIPLWAHFTDSIPPITPLGLKGTIDSNGVVTVTWDANPESDLQGYRVFFANQEDHEFTQLTTDITKDTVYTDTLELQMLSEHIYYKVTALDLNFNHSPFTETLKLKKPDIIAPVAPIISDVTATEKSVQITWRRSPSKDVAGHTVFRRVSGDSEWREMLNTSERNISTFTDETAEALQLYEYAVQANDDDGLLSPLSNIVSARVYDSGIREGVEGLTYEIDLESNRIVLRWKYANVGDFRFYVYKAVGDDALALVESIEGNVTEFFDTEITSGTRYRYGLKVVTDDGGESPIASTETIEVK